MGDVQVTALNGISMTIKKGEFVAVMGASGSGKSTLMNILGCLDRPSKGKYYLEGVDVSRLSKNELADIRNKKLGYVFQSFNLLSRTTVLENIELPLIYSKKLSKIDRDSISQIMATLGIKEFQRHYPNQLSGGQQQRVAIARAIINNPSLLLADEPTGNLDPKTGGSVMEFLSRLNKDQGKTIVMVTHDGNIAEFAERIEFLRDGVIIKSRKGKNHHSVRKGGSEK